MVSRYAGANHPIVRRNNRAAIFRALHELAPVARVDLARETGLNDKTVTNIVDELISHGLARETGYRSAPRAGRRALEIEVNATARYAIGIDFTRTEATGALVDLSGNAHGSATEPVPDPWRGEHILPIAIKLIGRLREAASRADEDKVVGIGIGVPNPLSIRGDHFVTFDSTGTGSWLDLGTPAELAEQLGLPTYIDHHANTSALAELWFGNGKRVDNFVLLNLGPGVGASLVINGDLFRGAHDSAGEMSYMTLNAVTAPGRETGDIQQYLSRRAILDVFRAAIRDGEPTSLRDEPDLTITETITALQVGDELAVRIFDNVARYLAALIGNIVSILDPELILIGRDLAQAGDDFLDPVRGYLRDRVSPAVRGNVRIEGADVRDAPVIGAATLALREFFRSPLSQPG